MIVLLQFWTGRFSDQFEQAPMIYFFPPASSENFQPCNVSSIRCSVRSIRSGVSVTNPRAIASRSVSSPAAAIGGVPIAQ